MVILVFSISVIAYVPHVNAMQLPHTFASCYLIDHPIVGDHVAQVTPTSRIMAQAGGWQDPLLPLLPRGANALGAFEVVGQPIGYKKAHVWLERMREEMSPGGVGAAVRTWERDLTNDDAFLWRDYVSHRHDVDVIIGTGSFRDFDRTLP